MSNQTQKLSFIPLLVFEILQFKESCILNSRTRCLPDMWFLQKVRILIVFSYSTERSTMDKIIVENPKDLIFGPFSDFLDHLDLTESFFKKLSFTAILILWLPNSMQKIRKKLMSYFEILHCEQTDWHEVKFKFKVFNTICLVHIESPGSTSKKKSCIKRANNQNQLKQKPSFQRENLHVQRFNFSLLQTFP